MGATKRLHRLIAILAFLSTTAHAVQIVTEVPNVYCEELTLARELRVFKDPALVLPQVSLVPSEGGVSALADENLLLTTLTGTVHLMRLGPPRPFRNFTNVSRAYELAESRGIRRRNDRSPKELLREQLRNEPAPMIIPVKFCGQGEGYSDALGFVLKSELELAQQDEFDEWNIPPSTLANPIPKLPERLLGTRTGELPKE